MDYVPVRFDLIGAMVSLHQLIVYYTILRRIVCWAGHVCLLGKTPAGIYGSDCSTWSSVPTWYLEKEAVH